MAKPKPPEDMDYEEAFAELEQVVAKLELGDQPLEEALATFEHGQSLAARCTELLDNAELKLKELVPDGSGGYQEDDFEGGVS